MFENFRCFRILKMISFRKWVVENIFINLRDDLEITLKYKFVS